MKTAFSEERMVFTKKAHIAAQRQFYSHMYPAGVEFEDTVQTKLDLEYAIDCQLALTVRGMRAPVRMSVQERYRKPHEMHYGDVTITEWNLASNQPSELHKLSAQMFVYGFYDELNDQIVAAVAVDVGLMQYALANGYIGYDRRRRVDQSFLGFKVGDLEDIGALVYSHNLWLWREAAA